MQIIAWFFIAWLGACIGSFLNVVILRLHAGDSAARGRSYCPECHYTLEWYDLIPVVSFLMLGGQCRRCRKQISWQYPAVEVATAVLFIAAAVVLCSGLQYDPSQSLGAIGWYVLAQLVVWWVLLGFLVVLFVYDLRWMLVPDAVSIPAIILVIASQLLLQHACPAGMLTTACAGMAWTDMVLAATIGGGFFGLQYIVSRGRWVGSGDIALGILAGCIVGWPAIIGVLFLAYMLGAVVSVPLLLGGKKQMESQVPFGIFLVPAIIVVMFYQPQVVSLIERYLFIQ